MKNQESIPDYLKIGYLITLLIMVVLVLLVIFVVVIYNKRKMSHIKELKLRKAIYENTLLQEKLEKQAAIQREREQFSSDLHDEVGAGISAIKLRIEFIKNLNQDIKIDRELNELLYTSQTLNTSMREMLWNLNNEKADIDQFLRYIHSYGHTFFEKTTIKFQSQCEVGADAYMIDFSQKKHLIACIKESLNNIYKHSGAKTVNVTYKISDKILSINIKDDGIGISANYTMGNGCQNIQKRMQAINGNVVMQSTPGATTIKLSFPLMP